MQGLEGPCCNEDASRLASLAPQHEGLELLLPKHTHDLHVGSPFELVDGGE